MASNRLPDQLDRLFALAEDMADGAHAHEATIGLLQNKETGIRADLTAAESAENGYQTKRQAKIVATTAQTVADSNGKAFIATAKSVLENFIGRKWTQVWATAGFVNGSTAMPTTLAERQSCLSSLQTYFTNTPAHENAPLNVTAAQAGTRFTAMSDTRSAVNDAINEVNAAKGVRATVVHALRTRMTGLIAELEQLLGKEDPRWYAFGLNRPGDPETPGVPDGLVLAAGPAGTSLVDWAAARRAHRYRVFVQIVGTDPGFRHVLTVTDSDATLTGQPSGSTMKVRVTALNDAGESAPSAEATIIVP